MEQRPGIGSARFGVHLFKNGEGAIAIGDVGVPVQTSEIARQSPGDATVAIAILLIAPPGVVNKSHLRLGSGQQSSAGNDAVA